ncbi:MAG: AMP-binding protein [Bacillota bacterium]
MVLAAPAPDLARGLTPDESARALLALVAGLVRELQPSADIPAPRLDSSLDRDLGLDSLARVELFLRLEHAFGVRLSDRLLAEAETPRDLLRAVLAGSALGAQPSALTPIALDAAREATVPDAASTLIDALRHHVDARPRRTHVIVLDDEGAEDRIAYGALFDEAQTVARSLAGRGVGDGARVAIMLPTSREFFTLFVGVLMAGAVPVPIYPPTGRAIEEHLRRQSLILANCAAAVLVAPPEAHTAARALRSLVPSLVDIVMPAELAQPREAALASPPSANDLALLQYTSGSTGDPKGVMVTHANLLANVRAMGRTVRATANDVFVSWLPLYHDMGLIGAWMGALYFAFPLVVMSPMAFVNRPARWLQALHRYRGTISSAPNFAYEICASRLAEEELAGLDLSAWRLAFNGSEPVSADTLERFARRFEPHGLRRTALTPVYGLAECAVGLAFPPLERGPRIERIDRGGLLRDGEARLAAPGDAAALAIVACGMALPGHEIRVIGGDGRELAERLEGRIQFRGPSATSGYFRNPARSRELFDGGWLDTGDLGYVADGELFITGRAKDVIIRGGQHIHPQEIEAAVGGVPGVRRGCVAVFGVADAVTATEKVVVLAETRLVDDTACSTLRAAIGAAVVSTAGAPADEILIVPPHAVPKTPSGKIRRAAARDLYLRGVSGRAGASWTERAQLGIALLGATLRRASSGVQRWTYGTYAWFIAASFGAVALAGCLLPGPAARSSAVRTLARAALRVAGISVATRGLENVPAAGAVIFAANHASYVDAPALFASLPRDATFVAKRELASAPVVGFALSRLSTRFVERAQIERGIEDARLLEESARGGEALVFFPEGTFTRAPGLRPFHMGPFVAAARSGAPVVPVSLRGTRSILRDGQWLPRRGTIAITFHEPIRPAGEDWRSAVMLRDAARAQILAHCGEPDLPGS